MPAFGDLLHWARTNDSGTSTDKRPIKRNRPEPARCAPGDITQPARSHVRNFGSAPTIHPLPQCPPAIGVRQLANVTATLSFRENPPPGRPRKHEIVSRL